MSEALLYRNKTFKLLKTMIRHLTATLTPLPVFFVFLLRTEVCKYERRVSGADLRSTLFSNMARRLVTSVFSSLILNALRTDREGVQREI